MKNVLPGYMMISGIGTDLFTIPGDIVMISL
jgi:hypothetical protein